MDVAPNQKGRRSRREVYRLRTAFRQILENSDGICPRCSKRIENLSDNALMYHCDGNCSACDSQQRSTVPTVVHNTEFPVSQTSNIQPSQQFIAPNINQVHNWDAPLVPKKTRRPQVQGDRQTAFQVRANLNKEISNSGTSVGRILFKILEKENTVSSYADKLELARECTSCPDLPSSWHTLSKAIRMRSVDDVDYHICDVCWDHAWMPTRKEDWPDCSEECRCKECICPKCYEENGTISRRFEKTCSGLAPKQRFYYFGLEQQINQMFMNKEFRRSRLMPKTFDKVGSWWNSDHIRWINGMTGGLATHENDLPINLHKGEALQAENGLYSLHFDWVQATKLQKRCHSVGLIVLRCDDVEERMLNKNGWGMPLMLIPGPKEPKSMKIHWKVIREQFSNYSEGKLPLKVSYIEDGEQVEFIHKPFLTRVCCDTVARHKLVNSRGAASLHPCHWCWMESDTENVKMFGYTEAVNCTFYKDWDKLDCRPFSEIKKSAYKSKVFAGDALVTLEQHTKREDIIDKLKSNPFGSGHSTWAKKLLGISGRCELSSLKTIHPLEFVYLPMYHTLFLGLVKGFLRYIFRSDLKRPKKKGTKRKARPGTLTPHSDVDLTQTKKVGKAKEDEPLQDTVNEINVDGVHSDYAPIPGYKKTFKKACSQIIRNCDLDEQCIDIENASGWLVSPLIAFLETYSCYIFNEEVCGYQIISEKARTAWGYLRTGVMYFLRDSKDITGPDQWKQMRNDAKESLLEYARICEQDMPQLCVQNLHLAICRLFKQEEFSGRPNICHDMYMENELGVLKRTTYKIKHEVSMVHKWLIAEGRRWLSQATCLESDNRTVEARKDPQAFDKPSLDSMNYFKDKGKLILCQEFDSFYQKTLASFKRAMPMCTDEVGIYTHGHLQRHSDGRFEEVKSLVYTKEMVRNSKVVLVNYEKEVRLAVVEKFFRVTDGFKTLYRGFSCHIFHGVDMLKDYKTGHLYRYRHYLEGESSDEFLNDCDFEYRAEVLPIEAIISKVSQYIHPRISTDDNGKKYKIVHCAVSKGRSGKVTDDTLWSWLRDHETWSNSNSSNNSSPD